MGKSLNENIGSFYDASTPLWLDAWGDHMHHGFYESQAETVNPQLLLIEKLLQFGGVTSAKNILDAGCGVGGSARFLANKFGADALGVTLSAVQVERGNQLSTEAGLSDRVSLAVGDMMQIKKSPGSFDLIWSLESAEHIEEKRQLLQNFHDLLRPKGHLIMATWCHRNTPPDLTNIELRLMKKLSRLYHLPPMKSLAELKQITIDIGFEQVNTVDWSDAVAPFWDHVIRSVFRWKNLTGLSKAGWSTIKGAWAMQYMKRGYRLGTLKFGVLSAVKK